MDSILEQEIRDACSSGDLNKVSHLLNNNPSLINIRDVDACGGALISYAAVHHKKDVVSFLIKFIKEKGLNVNDFAWVYANFDVDIAEMLIDAGVNVNCPNHDGITPLHAAVLHGKDNLVNLLLSRGANVNSRDTLSGATPLFYAAAAGRTRIAEILLKNGANPNVRATGRRYFWGDIRVTPGMTALGLALISRESFVAEVIRNHGGLE